MIALSSAEAGLYASLKARCQAIDIQRMASDFGIEFKVIVHIDASAALAISNKMGLGKLRHTQAQHLFIQHQICGGRPETKTGLGKLNPADMFTTLLSAHEIHNHLEALGFEPRSDKCKAALDTGRASNKFLVEKEAAIRQSVEQFQLERNGDQLYMAAADEKSLVGRRGDQSNKVCRVFGLTKVDSITQSRSNTEFDAMSARLHINTEVQDPHWMVTATKHHSNVIVSVPNRGVDSTSRRAKVCESKRTCEVESHGHIGWTQRMFNNKYDICEYGHHIGTYDHTQFPGSSRAATPRMMTHVCAQGRPIGTSIDQA